MKAKTPLIIVAVCCLVLVLAAVGLHLFYIPPSVVSARRLGRLIKFHVMRDGIADVFSRSPTVDEQVIWSRLSFILTDMDRQYPGESPDYEIELITNRGHYLAMYNKGEDIVFFSFVDDKRFRYGSWSEPPAGGWTQPLYYCEATPELLRFLLR